MTAGAALRPLLDAISDKAPHALRAGFSHAQTCKENLYT